VGAQRDPCIDIAGALGKEVEDSLQPLVAGGEFVVPPPSAAALGQFLPCLHGKAVIFGEARLAEHVGVKLRGISERTVVAIHFAGKEVAGELHGVGPDGLGRGEMDVARVMQQLTATAFGIVNAVDGSFDPVDSVFRKLKREARAGSRSKIADGIERCLHV
jgi:hypothetical protein